MWNEEQRQRFAALREHERQGLLTPLEKTELDGLYDELEALEAAYLAPATERTRQETENLRVINDALRTVIRRKEERLALMKAALAQWRAEREELDAELDRLLSQAAQAEVSAAS